jgi:hypothetical protein
MVMHYYWGLAPGHTYTHGMDEGNLPLAHASSPLESVDAPEWNEPSGNTAPQLLEDSLGINSPDDDDPELGFDNRQDDFIDDAGIYDDGGEDEGDDEEFFAMNNMYGFDYD